MVLRGEHEAALAELGQQRLLVEGLEGGAVQHGDAHAVGLERGGRLERPLDEFDPLDWVLGTAEEAAGWTWDNIGVPVVNGLASFGQAMIDNPAATGTMLLGLGMMALGAAGEGVGIALLPTGLVTFGGGTAAGGVVMVGSAELIAAGAAVTAAGGRILFAEAVNNPQFPTSPRQRMGQATGRDRDRTT